MTQRMLSTKVPGDLLEAVDAVAEAQGMTRSQWVREALEASVQRDRSALGEPVSAGGMVYVECTHPSGYRQEMVGYAVCTRCQRVLSDEVMAG